MQRNHDPGHIAGICRTCTNSPLAWPGPPPALVRAEPPPPSTRLFQRGPRACAEETPGPVGSPPLRPQSTFTRKTAFPRRPAGAVGSRQRGVWPSGTWQSLDVVRSRQQPRPMSPHGSSEVGGQEGDPEHLHVDRYKSRNKRGRGAPAPPRHGKGRKARERRRGPAAPSSRTSC